MHEPAGRGAPHARLETESGAEPARPLLAAPPRPRIRIAVGAAVVLALVGFGAAVVASMLAPHPGAAAASRAPSDAPLTVDGAPADGVLVVHVLGAVEAPGIYQLRPGARVLDAVAAAGGFAGDAARDGLNLADELRDGEQLLVPVEGAPPPAVAGPPGLASDGVVNLNTADEAALETLPLVGPAMAQRIIAYREANGGFRSVQDLLGVTGIGEKTFAAIEPLVTV